MCSGKPSLVCCSSLFCVNFTFVFVICSLLCGLENGVESSFWFPCRCSLFSCFNFDSNDESKRVRTQTTFNTHGYTHTCHAGQQPGREGRRSGGARRSRWFVDEWPLSAASRRRRSADASTTGCHGSGPVRFAERPCHPVPGSVPPYSAHSPPARPRPGDTIRRPSFFQ